MSKTKYDSNIASKENSVDEIQEVSKGINKNLAYRHWKFEQIKFRKDKNGGWE